MKTTWYDKEEDVLNIELRKGTYWKSVELSGGVIMDIDNSGAILAIEIHRASKVFTGDVKKVIEQARIISV